MASKWLSSSIHSERGCSLQQGSARFFSLNVNYLQELTKIFAHKIGRLRADEQSHGSRPIFATKEKRESVLFYYEYFGFTKSRMLFLCIERVAFRLQRFSSSSKISRIERDMGFG